MKTIDQHVELNAKTSVKKDIDSFCMADHRIKIQRQKVRVITSHLLATFRIEASKCQLVFVLANSTTKTNYDALAFWVNQRFESIESDDYHAWNNTLEAFLLDAL